MADLTALKEKRKEYVKAQAERIANYMVNKGLMTDTEATCGSSNWDTELHNAMSEIARELLAMGIRTTSKVNFGVTDWTFTIAIN
jgi:hypothetical protein